MPERLKGSLLLRKLSFEKKYLTFDYKGLQYLHGFAVISLKFTADTKKRANI